MKDEWDEWARIYQRMNQANRRVMLQLMKLRLMQLRLMRLCPRRRMERSRYTYPVQLALLQAAIAFLCLGLLPRHPLAMPTAMGLGLAAVVYVGAVLCK